MNDSPPFDFLRQNCQKSHTIYMDFSIHQTKIKVQSFDLQLLFSFMHIRSVMPAYPV